MRMYDLIMKKRSGMSLTKEEIECMITGYTKGEIPDYQMSAFLMAVYFQGMTDEETLNLTMAMAYSGDRIELSESMERKADKHSTGGVGDKTSLVLCPMAAACGVPIAKISGRGLGHTGGTIDKLESFCGFSACLSRERFIRQVYEKNIAIISQTADLAPADKKLYALRDVTATMDNISLLASSIMSKKLAAGADVIVLDVKTGSGAFMKRDDDAVALAREMVKIGTSAGKETVAIISDMNQPLGCAIGNALEVREAIEALKGNGAKDLLELCLALGSYMLVGTRQADTIEEARERLLKTIEDGSALRKLMQLVEAQGGDVRAVEDTALLPKASIVMEIKAECDGFIEKIETDEIGMASMLLGAGRETMDSEIDLSAGIVMHKKLSAPVKLGETIATMYGNDLERLQLAKERFLGAVTFSKTPVTKEAFIKWIITANGTTKY